MNGRRFLLHPCSRQAVPRPLNSWKPAEMQEAVFSDLVFSGRLPKSPRKWTAASIQTLLWWWKEWQRRTQLRSSRWPTSEIVGFDCNWCKSRCIWVFSWETERCYVFFCNKLISSKIVKLIIFYILRYFFTWCCSSGLHFLSRLSVLIDENLYCEAVGLFIIYIRFLVCEGSTGILQTLQGKGTWCSWFSIAVLAEDFL